MRWIGILGCLAAFIGLVLYLNSSRKVFFLGGAKFVQEGITGIDIVKLWETKHPDLYMRREGVLGSWTLCEKAAMRPDTVIDEFPCCSVKKAARHLQSYLFDAEVLPQLNLRPHDPLLEKYTPAQEDTR